MTFTFTVPFTDISRVRWAIGDIDPAAAQYDDELITALIAEYATWQAAVIALIDHSIAVLTSTPDFQADWLKVSPQAAIANYRKLRAEKVGEYGLEEDVEGYVSLGGGIVNPTRPDLGAASS